jgi:drug/metabolite transporter (DMT)-like permease
MTMRWLLVGAVVGSTVASDLLQSWGMKRQGEVTDFRPSRIAQWFRQWPMALAVTFMASSFFVLLKLLQREDLSFAVPATAASLVIETFLAKIVLKENVDPRRWLGAVLVAAGVALLART